jgi:hypothetical protein
MAKQVNDCQILYFALSMTDDFTRITDLGYNATYTIDPQDLTFANLANYNVLVIWNMSPGLIGSYRTDIVMFVSAGGSLFIHEPRFGIVDYAPDGLEVAILSSDWCNQPAPDYWACIVDFSHPITSGLSNSDLTASWRQVFDLGPEYTVLTQNCVCLDPALAMGSYNAGKVLFDTGYFSPSTLVPGSDEYIMRIFDYLCESAGVQVQESSWGSLKACYR